TARAEPDSSSGWPLPGAPVDVFIATYNEPFDILERTIVSATCIDHPDLRVWVLDDGARQWVGELAEEHLPCQGPACQGGKRQQWPGARIVHRTPAPVCPAARC